LGFTTVRAILGNPRYLGRHVFARQAEAEVLLDPDRPALGHVTRMRWQERWQRQTGRLHAHPAVDDTTWYRAQKLIDSSVSDIELETRHRRGQSQVRPQPLPTRRPHRLRPQ
jgi:hypothetical protein